ncbi:GNAT family N-acetyltransferase [Luteimonas sp. Y-2-2-4F]|nr:GNAT family N-acetyltransferase [Luteimonas sp. Y-2-2-4F]MCD9033556.1 GNAT family N-acetyltransferase [Luteimonas sp. Y-2-2-4F]
MSSARSASAPLRVLPLDAPRAEAARALRVDPAQTAWAGEPAWNVERALADAGCEPMAVLLGEVVVGFYRLDPGASLVARQPLPEATLALRAFALDRDWQGLGLGRRAMAACCLDLSRRGRARLLGLNVHLANLAALRLYRGAGFVDSGELVWGGRAGPQSLLLRAIGPTADA